MTHTQIHELLLDAIRNRRQIRIARGAFSNVHGFPLAVGERLILLAQVEDWRLDGYTLVRRADVTEVRSGDMERFSERVLSAEGELTRLHCPSFAVPTDSWFAAFRALEEAGLFVLVHEEEAEDEPMSIGPVVAVHWDEVLVHYVDATGAWEDEATEVDLADVTLVQFADRYSSVFERHAAPSRPRYR